MEGQSNVPYVATADIAAKVNAASTPEELVLFVDSTTGQLKARTNADTTIAATVLVGGVATAVLFA